MRSSKPYRHVEAEGQKGKNTQEMEKKGKKKKKRKGPFPQPIKKLGKNQVNQCGKERTKGWGMMVLAPFHSLLLLLPQEQGKEEESAGGFQ